MSPIPSGEWTIEEDAAVPAPVVIPVQEDLSTVAGLLASTAQGLDFLGEGVPRPFVLGNADIRSARGVALVTAAVGQILGTKASSDYTQGELPWRGEFGSLVHLLRFAPDDAAANELARVYVADALQRWEPRVRLTQVWVSRSSLGDGGRSTQELHVRFNLVDLATGAVVLRDLSVAVAV